MTGDRSVANASATDVQHLLRELAPQVLGAVARRHAGRGGGEFAMAEDAVQDAMIAAATQWPVSGVPGNPRGWLYSVAIRRLTDYLRADIARRKREEVAASAVWAEWAFVPPVDETPPLEDDDSLTLLFMCCHESLTPASAIALTLRAVGGLTTLEIARAFMVPEATMAQRISRAKQTIKASGAAFALPDGGERGPRLHHVLHVLYLLFNEGYASSGGPELLRDDLSAEAIRLVRLLHRLLPADLEVNGLLALLLLTDARRAARTGPQGELIPLDEQDRSRWDQAQIAEGLAIITATFGQEPPGRYQLQAAIAGLHDEAPSAEATDWRQIMALYAVLRSMENNPMVELNYAIAVAMVEGPAAGLLLIAALEDNAQLHGHYRLSAVRGHLYERLGDRDAARRFYAMAADGTASVAERNFLQVKAARLSGDRV
jgi:RNA polymerase sigma factor (sigma-70 family)